MNQINSQTKNLHPDKVQTRNSNMYKAQTKNLTQKKPQFESLKQKENVTKKQHNSNMNSQEKEELLQSMLSECYKLLESLKERKVKYDLELERKKNHEYEFLDYLMESKIKFFINTKITVSKNLYRR